MVIAFFFSFATLSCSDIIFLFTIRETIRNISFHFITYDFYSVFLLQFNFFLLNVKQLIIKLSY